MKRSGAQCRKRRKILENEAAECIKIMEGFVRQLPFPAKSAVSDSVKVPPAPVPDAYTVNMDENEMNDDNHDFMMSQQCVTLDTSTLDDGAPFVGNVISAEPEPCTSACNTPPLNPDVMTSHDIGHLTFDPISHLSVIPQSLSDAMIKEGAIQFQNACCPFSTLIGERSMTRTWFQRHLANGTIVNRSWLLYSPLKESCVLLLLSFIYIVVG